MLARVMPEFDFRQPDALPTARAMATTMIEAMRHHQGIGLAANQVGIEERVFAMETTTGSICLFNPTVTWLSAESDKMEEGCLTFEGLELTISRPKECQVRYTDAEGQTQVLDLKGIEARCALHEMDHLDGIVFTGRVSKLKLQMAKKKALKRKK
jgi:peptide deformylase